MRIINKSSKQARKKMFEADREAKAHIKAKKDAQTKNNNKKSTKKRMHRKIVIRGRTMQAALFYCYTNSYS